MFDYLAYRNTVPVEKFSVGKIPSLNPFSAAYKDYWKGQKRKCIEGYWVEHEGQWRWMTGPCYFYTNFWHILLKEKSSKSKTKAKGRPKLRDLEWIKSYVQATARGFSGFEGDTTTSCHRALLTPEEIPYLPEHVQQSLYGEGKALKSYVPALEFLYSYQAGNLGKPLYYNDALNIVDIESRGGGKALADDTLLFYDGHEAPIGQAKIGDRIRGADGKLATITDVFPQGNVDTYRLTFRDGKQIECCANHLWEVYKPGAKGTVTVALRDMLDTYVRSRKKSEKSSDKEYLYSIPTSAAFEYPAAEQVLEPYYLGLWLGDGSNKRPGITTEDQETVDYLEELAGRNGLHISINYKKNNKAHTYHLSGKGSNPLLDGLRSYNLLDNKHIPKAYLEASYEQRIALLQGLMDTDGFADSRHTEFYSSHKPLADDFEKLIGGLGISYRRTTKETSHKLCHRFSLYATEHIFRLSRKRERQNLTSPKAKKNTLVNIEPVGKQLATCILVDNADHLFVAGDHLVTHNSYTGSGMVIGHNFLFDGAMDYDEWLQKMKEGSPMSSETLIGAISSAYTKDLVKKVKFGLENMEGGFSMGGTNYAPPLSKKFTDNWEPGATVIQQYKVKVGGRWEERGTRSKIQHRTFKDNAFAANGTRPSVAVLDEVGFMSNLEEALGQMKECTADGAEKFGTIWMKGTGGDMDGGATEAVKKVFYDPVANQCMAFDDIFEGSGKLIGFFIPAWMTLNDYKDELGNTDKDRAMNFLLKEREKLAAGKSKAPLHNELQQRPIVPSEAFLLSEGNVFPAAELKAHLAWLEASPDGDVKGQQGVILVDGTGTMTWDGYLDSKNRAVDYPAKDTDNLDGVTTVWEHPEEGAAYGLYVGGCDPVDQEKSNNSISLGSVVILKRAMPGSGNSDKIVAEYSGHPQPVSAFHENARRLIAYYNGQLLYENMLPGLKAHFDRHHSLRYLAYTPSVLKSNATTSVARTYGQHMTVPVKDELELATRDWLLESAGDGKLNLHQIYSVPLLKELIAYNEHGNYDRVIALMLAVCQKMQMHFIVAKKKEQVKRDSFFTRVFAGGNNW